MAVNYYWLIESMETSPSEDGLMDVVKIVNWRRFASFGDILVVDYGSMPCVAPSSTDFTAYPDLTYEQVCGWLDAGLDVSSIDLGLDKQIENIINPAIIVLPLPFNNPTI